MDDKKIIMGLDYGTKTVGVAVSDPLGITAQGVETIFREQENKLRRTYARIEQLAMQYHVREFVVGYPVLLNGDESTMAQAAKDFAANLERRTGINTVMWDERLTSIMAGKTLMEAGVRREDRKKYVDKIAAVFILQSYLDRLQAGKPETEE